MSSWSSTPRYTCRNCLDTIGRSFRAPYNPTAHAQRRYKSSSSGAAASFRIAKHYGAVARKEEGIARRSGSLKGINRPVYDSGLKVNLNDGQYIARSRKRIPHTETRIAPPDIRKRALPDAPPVHVPVEPRAKSGKRPLVKKGIKTPTFIHGRQFNKTAADVETGEYNFLEQSITSTGDERPPVKIWSAEKPVNHASLHYGKLQDWNWYWETMPPTMAQKTQAKHFFTKKASPKFLQSVAFFRAFPESDVPEVAFVGRSNVGKSSLLNAIVNADTKALLARTSSTPGFTKTMNLYGLGPMGGVHYKKQPSGHGKIVGPGGITIVDMPGYGEGSLSEWGIEIMKYLQGRKQLRRVFVLIDAQHGIKDKDRSLLASLRLGGVSHQVILSKLDKIYLPDARDIKRFDGKRLDRLKRKGTLEELRATMEKLRNEIKPPMGGGALGEILACSSEVLVDGRRLGIDAVRYAMLQAIGFPFRQDQGDVERARKEGPLIRTMKTNRAPGSASEDGERGVSQVVVRKTKSDALDQLEATLSAKGRRFDRRAGRR